MGYSLGFVVLLVNAPLGGPHLVDAPSALVEVQCVPVAAELSPMPRVYLQGNDGRWIWQEDTRPWSQEVAYCAGRLGIYSAWTADGPRREPTRAQPMR